MKHIGTYKIPTCYIGYIEYGDASGLSDLDVELVNAFLDSEFSHHGVIVDWRGIGEPYFSAYPRHRESWRRGRGCRLLLRIIYNKVPGDARFIRLPCSLSLRKNKEAKKKRRE